MFSRRLAARLVLLATLAATAAATDFADAQTQPQSCKGGTGCAASSCPTSITAAQAVLPTAACPFAGESQAAVDVFSWNEFIALNWPATSACTADTKKSILNIKPGNQGPVVWQTQMSADNVFVAPNQNPAAWCKSGSIGALFAKKPRAFGQTSKLGTKAHGFEQIAASISQPTDPLAVGGVVTDQSGRWLRYELLMNQTEYTAITTNNWYRLSVLNAQSSITLPTGSLELKSAWKILTPAEIKGGRYYTTIATVYNTPDGAKSPGKNPVTLGLVGLHIIQKTPQQPGFFWSTFEQVDNEKVFFNPNSSAPVNTQTAKKPYVELDPKTGKPLNAPVQIKRINPIPADPLLNTYYQTLLAGSVFANYRLVSTQWQTGGAPQGTPPNVANIVTETYVQSVSSKPPEASTGCLACHKNATSASGKTLTDHSFMFLQAQ